MDLKLGIIVPDRGDRPRFLENCIRMINAQDKDSNFNIDMELHLVLYPPKDNDVDITPRYRAGYDYFRGKGVDVIAFMESDDWYSPIYLQTMLAQWDKLGRPDLCSKRSFGN